MIYLDHNATTPGLPLVHNLPGNDPVQAEDVFMREAGFPGILLNEAQAREIVEHLALVFSLQPLAPGKVPSQPSAFSPFPCAEVTCCYARRQEFATRKKQLVVL